MKVISCRIPDQLYNIIKDEIKRLNISNTEFFRMILINYFKQYDTTNVYAQTGYVYRDSNKETIKDIEKHVRMLRRHDIKD